MTSKLKRSPETLPASDWQRPAELPDLRRAGVIGLDLETKDGGLHAGKGSGWPWGDGHICGVSVAYRADGNIRAHYFPLRHPDSENFDCEQLFAWLKDQIASGVHIVTQNGLYDWGWLRAEAGIVMPPSEQLEEIGALATIVDENRHRYSLEALSAWRGLPGKDMELLEQAVIACGFPKKAKPQSHIWQLPARFVGSYAEADAANTLALFESLDPALDREGTRAAYRLEVDLLPMVHEMRRRGVRIDTAAAAQARDELLQKRDAAFAELSGKLGANISMEEIGRTKWLAETFDQQGITYPHTEKGNPSFTAGSSGWMHKHPHWLPQLIVKADKYNNAAVKFLEIYILGHTVNGRIHAEIHPHRSDDGGARSLRFSYSSPPLQQMTSHDEELAPLIRGVFLPEEGEVWAKPDISQQEFRFIVHYAARHKLRKAAEAAERYHNDPDTDFHALVAEWTGLDRSSAKNANFAKSFGAGVRKFAAMIGKPESEARAIYERYDREMPFVLQLSRLCERAAKRDGYITLYDGARRHFDDWVAPAAWGKGEAAPCAREEAARRVKDPDHPWHREWIRRVETHKAMNALIQGSAARHTKLWMRECWREGIVPLLQMHDCLDCSVALPEQAEQVAQLGREAVALGVPMQVDVKYGRNWGDAEHTWANLNGAAPKPASEPVTTTTTGAAPTDNVEECAAASAANNPPPPQDEEPEPPPEDPPPRGNGSGGGNGFGANNSFSTEDLVNHSSDGNVHGDNGPKHGRCTARWTYSHPDQPNYLRVERHDLPNGERKFYQHHWTGTHWASGVKGTYAERKIPYRLPQLKAALQANPNVQVQICEGESDADTMAREGFVATTNPGGALSWTPELTSWLRILGVRRAAIHEDNDGKAQDYKGQKRSALLTAELSSFIELQIVRYPDVPEGQDVRWWLEHDGHTKEELEARIAAAAEPAALPFPFVNMSNWDLEPVPEQQWIVFDRIPRRQSAIFSGEGGVGKSIIQLHLSVAAVLGRDWLGVVPEQGPAFFIDCEDDETVMHYRLAAIARYYDTCFTELINRGLHLTSLVGQETVLATVARSGVVEPTTLYNRLLQAAGDIKPSMIGIAASANVFAGDENNRSQVQQFINLTTRLAIVANGAVSLITHPSLTGINTGSGLSGTTQWHNAVRARFFLKSPKAEPGEQPDNDLREIEFKKNQYGTMAENIPLRWQDGLFLPIDGRTFNRAEQEARADEVFLELLHRFTNENRYVSSSLGPTYAPALFAKEDQARKAGLNSPHLAAAMRRLFEIEKIHNEPHGKASRQRFHLAIKL
jgi:RecA-family ATPase/DNA polymerase I-like protein with 3'-5' exonuclease and polymerase domains